MQRIFSFRPLLLLPLASFYSCLKITANSLTSQPTMPVQIGLTGSIGMGKSTASAHFKSLGFPVFDADITVHSLYSIGGKAVAPVRELCPDAIVEGAVNRAKLSERILQDPNVLKELENIVHPLVAEERKLFYEQAISTGALAVIYDDPLLLDYKKRYEVDYVAVVTASEETQKHRVMKRPGMTAEKFQLILSKQMPDAQKRALADFIINTDYPSKAQAKAQIANMIESIVEERPQLWQQWKQRTVSTMSKAVSPSRVDSESVLADHFDLIAFDLDMTLADSNIPVHHAEDMLFNYMDVHMPRTAVLARNNMKTKMNELRTEQPLIKHNLGELRKEALRSLCMSIDAIEEESKIENAIELFIQERSSIDPYLYSDSLPCLEYLSKISNMKLCILTNGNADIVHAPQLNQYITQSITAGDIGIWKPKATPFIALSQILNISPSRILFIGDHHYYDCIGAKNAGMITCWLNRSGEETIIVDSMGTCGSTEDIRADIIVSSLDVTELENKVRLWASK